MQVNRYAGNLRYSSNRNLLNSIVLIQVIDKIENINKILVDGSVYQASLPVGISTGESVLAKIKSLHPFVLQLDNLLDEENTEDPDILLLLQKLGNFTGRTAEVLLRKVIENNLPVIKSKFSALLDLLAKTQIEIDDSKYQLLPQILWEHTNFAGLTKKNINYFVYTLEELQNKIYYFLIEQKNRFYKTGALEELQNIIFTGNHSLKSELIEEHKKLAVTDLNLYDWVVRNLESEHNETAEAVKLILVYLFQKNFYKRIGLSPEFFVVDGEHPELIKFTVRKINNGINETYAVNFSFEQDDGTTVNSELLLSGQIGNIHFPNSILSSYKIQTLLKELPSKIKNNLDLAVKVMLKNNVRYADTGSFTGINATV